MILLLPQCKHLITGSIHSGVRLAPYRQRSTRSKRLRTILLVDDDLAFAFWLGQALDRAGFETLPARSVPAAESLVVDRSLSVHLLVISASLPRSTAFANQLGFIVPDLKVIAVYQDPEDVVVPFLGVNAILQKPHTLDTLTQMEWVQVVIDVLSARLAARADFRV